MAYFASDFANVDGTEAIEKFVRCLELQCSLKFYQDYKQKTFALLQPYFIKVRASMMSTKQCTKKAGVDTEKPLQR
jgi:hypothetical protein